MEIIDKIIEFWNSFLCKFILVMANFLLVVFAGLALIFADPVTPTDIFCDPLNAAAKYMEFYSDIGNLALQAEAAVWAHQLGIPDFFNTHWFPLILLILMLIRIAIDEDPFESRPAIIIGVLSFLVWLFSFNIDLSTVFKKQPGNIAVVSIFNSMKRNSLEGSRYIYSQASPADKSNYQNIYDFQNYLRSNKRRLFCTTVFKMTLAKSVGFCNNYETLSSCYKTLQNSKEKKRQLDDEFQNVLLGNKQISIISGY